VKGILNFDGTITAGKVIVARADKILEMRS
jgi:hypothetical protein